MIFCFISHCSESKSTKTSTDGSSSKVWKYFVMVDEKHYTCLLCIRRKNYKWCRNTTNLFNHLKLKHWNAYVEAKGGIQNLEPSELKKKDIPKLNEKDLSKFFFLIQTMIFEKINIDDLNFYRKFTRREYFGQD